MYLNKEFLLKTVLPKAIMWIIILWILYANFTRAQVYVYCTPQYIEKEVWNSIKTADLTRFGLWCNVLYQNGKYYEYKLKDLKFLKKNHWGKQE